MILAPNGKRQIIVLESHAEVPLTRGRVSLISLEDVAFVQQYNWFCSLGEYQARAARMYCRHMVYLHMDILKRMGNFTAGKEGDHINRDTLDNRRENLRSVSHTENMRNTDRHEKRRGFTYHKAQGLWRAYVSYPGGIQVSLGYWRSEEKAKEIAELGRGLQEKCNSIKDFEESWKQLSVREKYDRSKM